MDGFVAAVHRDKVDIHVHDQVAIGGPFADSDLLAVLRLPDNGVALFVFGVVVVEAVGIILGHDLLAQRPPKLFLRHPPMESQSGDEMNVFDAFGGGLLQHFLDHELAVVRWLHRGQRA